MNDSGGLGGGGGSAPERPALRCLCTICARSGSKGVPDKNIRLIAGRPLLAHSIQQALDANIFEAVAFSSDSGRYLEIARAAGANILVRRPAELASDAAGKLPAIRHCAEEAEARLGHPADIIVDLDCTSPLRLPDDIRACVDLLLATGAGNLITGTPARHSPYFNLVERMPDGRIALSKSPPTPLLRRQDAPPCYDMNASVYVWRRDALMERDGIFHSDTVLYVMPAERSVDIDSELDWDVVEMLLARRARRDAP